MYGCPAGGLGISRAGSPAVPLRDAVAIAFALSNPDSWRTLTEECGLTQAKALALTTTTLDATLFGQLPGRGP